MKLILYFPDFFLLQSVNNPASAEADKIHTLFNYFNIAAAGMLLLVIFLIVYICIKFKQKKGIMMSRCRHQIINYWKQR